MGGGAVIIDKCFYELEVIKLLSNRDYYKLKEEYNKLVTNENNGLRGKDIYYLVNL